MAITNGYATLAQARQHIGLTDGEDDNTVLLVERLVESASRAIDGWCGRSFYSSASATRYYASSDGRTVFVDDLVSVDSLTTDETGDRTYETTWSSASDYYLNPVNAAVESKPYTRIEVDGVNGRYTFPTHSRGVKVVGTFGWPATPKLVTEACLRIAHWLYKLKDAPLGVTEGGGYELGVARIREDQSTRQMLQGFARSRVIT